MAKYNTLDQVLEAAAGKGFAKIKDVMIFCLMELELEETDLILEVIYHFFPQANSGPKDVAWYRWKLRRAGKLEQRETLTEEERKARKAAYERDYKAKQQALKEARREEAAAERERIATERFEAAVADAVAKALAAHGIQQ